jgi:hypothetical protein
MDYLGMNPNQANSAGTQTMSLSESYRSLQGDLMGAVRDCIDAAGEPEVVGGYESFGETWSTDLAKTADHGESVGGTTRLTVADGVETDSENANTNDVPAPAVSAPGISPN